MHSTIRIFISSPGDVADERQIAGKVIEQVQGKYWSFVRLDDVFWEDRAVRATAHFQDELINPGDCEIVVGILWSRLGSPLPEKFADIDGLIPTGTEWELEEAFDAYERDLEEKDDPLKAKPDVLVYRRNEVRPVHEDTKLEKQNAEQAAALEFYLSKNYFNADGTILRPIRDYKNLDEFEQQFRKHLEELVLRMIPGLKKGEEPPPISGCPFKGLDAFDFTDRDRYFGRNRQIREVQERLEQRQQDGTAFVLIYGASGYGKSSLMRAGLAPVITRPGGISEAGDSTWRRVLLQPARSHGPLVEMLARMLLQPAPEEELQAQQEDSNFPITGLPELSSQAIGDSENSKSNWDIASLARYLAHEEDHIFAAAAIETALQQLDAHLLLQLDQLEEIFTESRNETEDESINDEADTDRESLFRAVHALSRCPRVWVLATMRSEFFPKIAEQPAFKSLVGRDGGYILSPPDAQMLSEIIRYPALAARLDYERTTKTREIARKPNSAEFLNDQIYNDAKDNPDALPLLEFCLTRLYEATLDEDGNRESDQLQWETYAEIGGLIGSIASVADATYEDLTETERDPNTIGKLFSSLVRVDPASTTTTRRRADLEQLRKQSGAKAFLGAFLEAKLLVTDEERAEDEVDRPESASDTQSQPKTVVFLAHECLLSHWQKLADWIKEHRGDLAAH